MNEYGGARQRGWSTHHAVVVGTGLGETVGLTLGLALGFCDGLALGLALGANDGLAVGLTLGCAVGGGVLSQQSR